MADRGLTLADHELAFALAALFTAGPGHVANDAMLRRILARSEGQCSLDNPLVAQLADAAGTLLVVRPGSIQWTRAYGACRAALRAWAMVRLGDVMDAAARKKGAAA